MRRNAHWKSKIITFFVSIGLVACGTPIKLLPREQINSMGIEAFSELKRDAPLEKNVKENAYIQCITRRIVKHASKKSGIKKWEVVLFKDEAINAFALPGGKIGIYSGLLQVAKTENQVAAVIGHEVGHVILEHSNQRISERLLIQSGLVIIGKNLGDRDPREKQKILAALGLGASVGIKLPHNRKHEKEADLTGLTLMAKAGFDPRASVILWQNMSKSGGNRAPEFLSTHPSHKNRIKDLNSKMNEALNLYEQAEKADCGSL